MTPEARARQTIDALLMQAGWHVCNMADANIHAARGLPILPLEVQVRIVAEADRRLSLVRGVENEVDVNLKRAQSLQQATLA